MVLDLSRCEYMDSGRLAVLLRTVRDIGPDRRLVVTGCNKYISRLPEIVDLTGEPAFQTLSALEEAATALVAGKGGPCPDTA